MSKGYRYIKNILKNKRGKSESIRKPGNEITKHDVYLVIWILKKLGWSSRRIARLKLPTSHNTINSYFSKSLDLIEKGILTISPNKGERRIKIIPMGNSEDISYLYGKIHQNMCGGGKRIMPRFGNDLEKNPGNKGI